MKIRPRNLLYILSIVLCAAITNPLSFAQTTRVSLPCPESANRSFAMAVEGDRAAYVIDYGLYVCRPGQSQAVQIETTGVNYPAISGNWVVYFKSYGIYAYNLESGKRLELEPENGGANSPAMSGDWIAYFKSYGVSLYNLKTGKKTVLEQANSGCNNVKIVGDMLQYSCNGRAIAHKLEVSASEASSSPAVRPAVAPKRVRNSTGAQDKKKAAVCKRDMGNARGSQTRLSSINKRLQKQFGFTCSLDGTSESTSVQKNLQRKNPIQKKSQLSKENAKSNPNFAHYVSRIGFEIDYPKGWEVQEVKGVDASLGGANFFPKGSMQSSARSIWNKDVTQQLITVEGGTNLKTYDETKKLLTESEAQELILHDVKGSATQTSRMTIDGEEAIIVSYVDSSNSLRGKAAVLLAKPTKNPKESLAIFLVIDYKAKDAMYSEETAMMVIGSFKEHVLKMMDEREKVEEQKADDATNQAISTVGNISPTYLPTGVTLVTRLPLKERSGQFVGLSNLYTCEADKYKRSFITMTRRPLSNVGNDIVQTESQKLKNLGTIVLSNVDVGGRKGVFATYNSKPYQLLWQDDTSFLKIEVFTNEVCTINKEELMKTARSMDGG